MSSKNTYTLEEVEHQIEILNQLFGLKLSVKQLNEYVFEAVTTRTRQIGSIDSVQNAIWYDLYVDGYDLDKAREALK